MRKILLLLPLLLAAIGAQAQSTVSQMGAPYVVYPDLYSSSADICVRINTALKALPAGGGIVDDSARNGSVTCSTNPWSGVTVPAILKLGSAVYLSAVTWNPSKNSQVTVGQGINNTFIRGQSSLTPIATMGATPGNNGIQITDLSIDCNSVASGVGIQNLWAQELSFVRRVGFSNCALQGLDIETTGAQNSGPYEDLYITASAADVAGTLCIKVNNAQIRAIRSVTCNRTTDGTTPNAGVLIDGSIYGAKFANFHFENVVDGFYVGSLLDTQGVNIDGAWGLAGMTNIVHVVASATHTVNGYNLDNINQNGSTNAINDGQFGITIQSPNQGVIGRYDCGDASSKNKTCLNTISNLAPTFEAGVSLLGTLSGNGLTLKSDPNTGVITNYIFQPIVFTADWTCGTGGTVASCVAATIVGATVTPMTFTLPSVAASWDLDCDLVVTDTTGTPANNWNLLTATNGATNVTGFYMMGTAAAVGAFGSTTDQASTTTTFSIGGAWTLGAVATKMPAHVHVRIEGASASGTVLSLQVVDPTVGDLLTIYRGSTCRIK